VKRSSGSALVTWPYLRASSHSAGGAAELIWPYLCWQGTLNSNQPTNQPAWVIEELKYSFRRTVLFSRCRSNRDARHVAFNQCRLAVWARLTVKYRVRHWAAAEDARRRLCSVACQLRFHSVWHTSLSALTTKIPTSSLSIICF